MTSPILVRLRIRHWTRCFQCKYWQCLYKYPHVFHGSFATRGSHVRKVVPIKLGTFPPRPADTEGQKQNALVFKESMQAIDGQTMDEYLDFPLSLSIYHIHAHAIYIYILTIFDMIWYYIIRYYIMFYYMISCYIIWYHLILYSIFLFEIISYYIVFFIVWYHIISYHIMIYYTVLYYIMLYIVLYHSI